MGIAKRMNVARMLYGRSSFPSGEILIVDKTEKKRPPAKSIIVRRKVRVVASRKTA